MLEASIRYLVEQPGLAFISMFWYALVFEIPRYAIGFIVSFVTEPWRDTPKVEDVASLGKISVLLAGHNEAGSLETCVRSLGEQTISDMEVICVDDGSTDGMYDVVRKLEREGLIHRSARLELRGGKAAGANLAGRLATGDVFVVLDCDCSLDRFAIERLVAPLTDPNIAGICGNIQVRNGDVGVTAQLQDIEYLISIGLGRTVMDMLDQVTCISGAFGAFRREAWDDVGGHDIGPGEDFDFTFRLRRRGWDIRFAKDALCYTDVPDTLWNYMQQRLRWERDAFWLRYRKHQPVMNPFSLQFRWTEAIHQMDFLLFHVLAAAVFPFYLVSLFLTFGEMGFIVLGAAALTFMVIDFVALCSAAIVMERPEKLRMLIYIPLYSLFGSFVMRFVRLYSYVDEWVFSRSRSDDYSPGKVQVWSSYR